MSNTAETTLRFIANVNANWEIDFVNEDYLNWLGYHENELLGNKTDFIRAPNSPTPLMEMVRYRSSIGKTVSTPLKEKKKNGETYWVDMRVQPKMIGGKFNGYTSVKRLITDPKRIAQLESGYQDLHSGKTILVHGQYVNALSYRIKHFLGITRFSLTTKTTLSMLAVVVVILGGALINESAQETKIYQTSVTQESEKLNNAIQTYFDKKLDIGESALAGITNSPSFWMSFNDRDLGMLDGQMKGLTAYFAKHSKNKNVRLQMIDEKGIAFYRNWVENQVEDDVSWRDDVQEQTKNPQVRRAYSLGKLGFTLKNHIPVYNLDKEYTGSVTLVQGLGSIHKDLLAENIILLAIMDTSVLNQYQQKVKNNPAVFSDGRYVLSSKKHFESEQTLQLLAYLKDKPSDALLKDGIMLDKQFFSVSSPIKDSQGKTYGYLVAAEPAAQFNEFLADQQSIARTVFIGIIITALLLSIIAISIMVLLVIRPLKHAQETMSNAVKEQDLFVRLPSLGQDEIAQMAKAYNDQAMLSQVVISETNTALEEILHGRLNHTIDFEFKSDNELLKTRLNKTSQGLQSTFEMIGRVMNDLNNGHFSAKHTHQLPGAYATVVNDCTTAMHSLNTIFSEISTIMNHAARGQFTQQITGQANGDVEALKNTINATLTQLEAGFADVISAANRLAEGDLTHPITNTYEYRLDEAKQAINQSMTGLSQTLQEISNIAIQLQNDVASVNEGTQNLNDRTQQQAASLEQTASAMEQTSAQTRSNLQNTQLVNEISQKQAQLLLEANDKMLHTKTSMGNIRAASDKIRDITSLIDSIAFQTNLLALNAAVEAARAGEHGRGFAVVASEVRNLAGKSADAAKEISHLVEQTAQAINIGVTQVDTVAEALDTITHETDKVRNLVEEVTQASQEQSTGIDEINKAIGNIDATTQQNAALVEETSATADSMAQSSQELRQSVQRFQIAGQNLRLK